MNFSDIRRIIRSIGLVTFFEIITDRILYNVLLFAVLVFVLGFLASQLSFLRPERIVLDFGFSAVNLSCSMIGVLVGAGLISKEFDRRTAYTSLARPISRGQLIFGRFSGLCMVLVLNWALLSGCFIGILALSTEKFVDVLSASLFVGLVLALLQSAVVASIATFFSTFTTTSLSVIFSFALFLVGHNISELHAMAAKIEVPAARILLKAVATGLPNLEYFDIGAKITYSLPVTWQFILGSITYGLLIVAGFIMLGGITVRAREV
ncbi:MAG: ABC transporter permease subunit [Bdellovibrionota bacterium]